MKKLLLFTFATLMAFVAGAQTWNETFSGFATDSRGITEISIADANVAWAFAYDGADTSNTIRAITKTIDGGVTWTATDPIVLTGGINVGMSEIFAIDADNAWVVAYATGIGTGGLWKTTDGGANWVKKSSSSMYSNSASFPNLLYFFDANNGFCQGDPINGDFELYSTTDGGETWMPISGSNIENPVAGEWGYVHGYVAAGNSVWFTTSKGRLYRSTDNGATFTAHQTPIDDFGGMVVTGHSGTFTFKDDNEGWLVGDYNDVNTLYHTTDGGVSWTPMTPTGNVFSDITYISGAYLISVGASSSNAGSSYSTDGGATWIDIDAVQHTCVSFLDINTGYSGGFSSQADNSGIFKYDAGSSIANSKIDGLNVYPNPATAVINISLDKSNMSSISIYDITGQEVYSLKDLDVNQVKVNSTDFAKGIYILKVVDQNDAKQTIKLVIK